MKHDLDPIDHESLSNTVYATLCDALIQGRFQPGDRLKIRDLAGQLGTSVTPIRDAILRLAHDEAIVFRSARDIRIPDVSEDRYLEIRSIRIRLEALAGEAEGADLLVMGAFGHSRIRDFFLGGATRHMLAGLNVPTLLSH